MAADRKPADPERKPADPSSFSPLDRAPVPEVVEADTASAWARFEALQRGEEVEPTQQSPLAGSQGAGSYDTTQPMQPAPRAGVSQQAPLRADGGLAPPRPLALADVMVMARRHNRACPLPEAWAAFHRLLPTRELHGRLLGAPLPISGAAWQSASAMEKRLRLRDQIEWAERTGALMAAYDFLVALPERQWHHFTDQP
jgi:hypothetical protein